MKDRNLNTMSDAISISSPSGRVSKRARTAALKRLSIALFGEKGLTREECHGVTPQRSEAERLRQQSKRLRDLAALGMCRRKCTREADRIDALLRAAPGPSVAD